LLTVALDLKEVLTGVQDLQQTVVDIVRKLADIDNRVQRIERQVRTSNDQQSEEQQANDRLLDYVKANILEIFRSHGARAPEQQKEVLAEQLMHQHGETLQKAGTTANEFLTKNNRALNVTSRTIRNNTRARIRTKLITLFKLSKEQAEASTAIQRKELFDKYKIGDQLDDICRHAFKCLGNAKIESGIMDFTRQTVNCWCAKVEISDHRSVKQEDDNDGDVKNEVEDEDSN